MNKNFTVFFMALLLSISSYSFAYEYSKSSSEGGFDGPRATSTTAKSVSSIGATNINRYVVLKGHLVNQIKEDYFTFKDDSGEIMVEIYYRHFRGQTITPESQIKIHGEVGLRWNRLYVYVNHLEVMK